MKHLSKVFAVFLLWVCLGVQAFSPEWITHETRGRVKYKEATTIVSLVHRFALQYDIDPGLIFRIIRVESNYNRRAISHCNARGLMQVVPKWHREKVQGRDLYNAEVGIEVGVRVIAEYLEKYGDERRALRAYYGDHRSDVYPRKIYAVNLRQHDQIYPGADNRDYDYLTPEDQFVGPLESERFLAMGQEFVVTHHPTESDSHNPEITNEPILHTSPSPTHPPPPLSGLQPITDSEIQPLTDPISD